MGKASKWFRAVLGLKKPDPSLHHEQQQQQQQQQQQASNRSKEKRRWSFVKSYREKDSTHHHQSGPTKRGVSFSQDSSAVLVQSSVEYVERDPNKRAIAVAAATAVAAEAAVAAAQAAAEVVRLTSSGRCTNKAAAVVHVSGRFGWREDLAANKIQSAFRGYLARRALRALKALVRLQALVRGHIARKQTAAWLHQMQVLLRAQARARAGRVQISESSHSSSKSSHFQQPGPPTPEKFEHSSRAKSGKYKQSSIVKRGGSKSFGSRAIGDQDKVHLSLNWSERRGDEQSLDQRVPFARSGATEDEKSDDKILEIDNGKPHLTPKRRSLFHSHHASDQFSHSFTTSKDSTTHQTLPSPSDEVQSHLSPLQFAHKVEDVFCTAENSPQFYSASSRGGSVKCSPFTPTKSDSSRSFLSSYSGFPNYMSYTESSRAKVRSLSAPKQRPQYERSCSAKRYSIHGLGEPRSSSVQRAAALHSSFTSKAYPGSGRLDRLGMPIGQKF